MLRVCVKCVVNTVFCGNDVHSLQSLQTLIAILEQNILKMLSVNSKTSDNLSCQMIYPNYITVFKKFFAISGQTGDNLLCIFRFVAFSLWQKNIMPAFVFFLLNYEVGIVGVAWPGVLQIEFGNLFDFI